MSEGLKLEARKLKALPPGGYCDIQAIGENFAHSVLNKVDGASREWAFRKIPDSPLFRFYRLLRQYPFECGILSYITPDLIGDYDGVPGRYVPKGLKSVWYNQDNVPFEERIYYSIEAMERDFYPSIRPGSTVIEASIPEPILTPYEPVSEYRIRDTIYTVREFCYGQYFREVYFYKLVRS